MSEAINILAVAEERLHVAEQSLSAAKMMDSSWDNGFLYANAVGRNSQALYDVFVVQQLIAELRDSVA